MGEQTPILTNIESYREKPARPARYHLLIGSASEVEVGDEWGNGRPCMRPNVGSNRMRVAAAARPSSTAGQSNVQI
jgi:hypothetical protein